MIQTSQQTISEFIEVLEGIKQNTYVLPCTELSESTIGQHTRHIIELYQCLIDGYNTEEVCYDNRNRNKQIERDLDFAILQLTNINNELSKPDKKLFVSYELNGNTFRLESNYYREVMYNLEHTIHHQALIKVAIQKLSNYVLSNSFGVAPSTLQYRNQCVL